MRLGKLGEQIVLLSEKSFENIRFIGYEIADHREYYYKRANRDQEARTAYQNTKKSLSQLTNDLFVLDLIREDMGNDDERIQNALS